MGPEEVGMEQYAQQLRVPQELRKRSGGGMGKGLHGSNGGFQSAPFKALHSQEAAFAETPHTYNHHHDCIVSLLSWTGSVQEESQRSILGRYLEPWL